MTQIIPLTLEWFSLRNDLLVGEETCHIDLDLALSLIEINKDYDPVIAYGYKVDENISKKVQKYFIHQINLHKFNYFLCSYSHNLEPRHVKYIDKPVWHTLKSVFKDLQEHGDIKCILDEDYVLGYLLDSLAYNNIVFTHKKGDHKDQTNKEIIVNKTDF